MITLRDIVIDKQFKLIEVRSFDAFGEDILIGYCSYINGELKALDGDSYSLDEPIYSFDIGTSTNNELLLIVYERGGCIGFEDEDIYIYSRYEADMLKKYLQTFKTRPSNKEINSYLHSLRKGL